MSAHRLNGSRDGRSPTAVPQGGNEAVHQAVLEVLGGVPLTEAAALIGVNPADLKSAVDVFCKAGFHALDARSDWWQLYVEFTDWDNAEHVVADHLLPVLTRLEGEEGLAWWFIRKHPCWRLRLRVREHAARSVVVAVLDELAAEGRIRRWWTGVYEPETVAFGGSAGMEAAHRLFHADSRAILGLRGRGNGALGHRETSVLLCTTLMRAAGLEWYEQGDVWDLVRRERALPDDVPEERLRVMAVDMRALLLADIDPSGSLFGPGGAAESAAHWAEGFRGMGITLGTTARAGRLERGLRRVLAYHVIFHWNRMGIPARTQAALAWAASAAVLDSAVSGEPSF